MLRVLNRIKRKLLKDGKVKRFLLYTIGEVVLIVIGILIALQIDNWNIQRKNRIREKVILRQLHADFLSNKIQLDSINPDYSIE